jgi:hypothetical protein
LFTRSEHSSLRANGRGRLPFVRSSIGVLAQSNDANNNDGASSKHSCAYTAELIDQRPERAKVGAYVTTAGTTEEAG